MATVFPVIYEAPEDLPAALPVFPLNGGVFFPRANLPLNIFEPRYLAMIDDAMRGHRIVGMIQPADEAKKPRLAGVGCAGRIVSYAETDDGRLLVTLRGIARFRVAEEMRVTTPYRQVRPDYAPFAPDFEALEPEAAEAVFERERYLGTLRQYLKVISVQIDWSWVERAPAEVLINSFAMLAPIEPQEKQALLEAPGLAERGESVLAIMDLAIAAAGHGLTGPGSGRVN
jgi:uncharacterized protein